MDKLLTEDQKPPERFPKSDHIELGSDGWLSPSGVFFKANKDEHVECADWIVKNNLGELEKNLINQKVTSNIWKKVVYLQENS